jgi:murein DD-endopeptidase MepM/ murein hydrolase activator NlpD
MEIRIGTAISAIFALLIGLALFLGAAVIPANAGQSVGFVTASSGNGYDPIPPGGDCRRTEWNYSNNPFSGWPIKEHVCDMDVIVWTYCSTYYPTEIPHWGIDVAYPGIEGADVLVTVDQAIVGRMNSEGRWNGGMGNYVELRAVECWKEKIRLLCREGFCVAIPKQDPGDGSGSTLNERIEVCRETDWAATYMHLMDVTVSVGQRVDRGEVIGHVGATGNASGFHLHYEITSPYDMPGGAVDPLPALCEEWVE